METQSIHFFLLLCTLQQLSTDSLLFKSAALKMGYALCCVLHKAKPNKLAASPRIADQGQMVGKEYQQINYGKGQVFLWAFPQSFSSVEQLLSHNISNDLGLESKLLR